MQRKIIVTTAILSALLFMAGLTACRHGHHPGGFDEFDLAAATDRIAARLDLTEVQKADLKRIAGEIAGKAKAMHADHANQHQKLADLVRREAIDREEIDQLIDEKMAKLRDMADFTAERLIAFHQGLTPEQREMIAAHIEDHASGDCRFGWR